MAVQARIFGVGVGDLVLGEKEFVLGKNEIRLRIGCGVADR